MKKNYSTLKYVSISLLAAVVTVSLAYLLMPQSVVDEQATEESVQPTSGTFREASKNDTYDLATSYWWDDQLTIGIGIVTGLAIIWAGCLHKDKKFDKKHGLLYLSVYLISVLLLLHNAYMHHYLLVFAREGNLVHIKSLVDKGAYINSRDHEYGDTALMLSAGYGHLNCLRYLHQKGADIDASNDYGETALILSAFSGHLNCLKYLHQQGADINASNDYGETALILSAQEGKLACVKYLVRKGANVDQKDKNGNTALERAKASKQVNQATKNKIVNYLSHL